MKMRVCIYRIHCIYRMHIPHFSANTGLVIETHA